MKAKIISALIAGLAFAVTASDYIRNSDFSRLDDKGVPAGWNLRDTKTKPVNSSRTADKPAVTVKDGVLKLDTDTGKFEVMLIHFRIPAKQNTAYNLSYQVRAIGSCSYRAVSQWMTAAGGRDGWNGVGGAWVEGSNEWKIGNLAIQVPADGRELYCYFAATGPGAIEFKDIKFKTAGVDISLNNELKVFTPDQKVHLVFNNLLNRENRIEYTITDFHGQKIASDSVTENSSVELPAFKPGYYEIFAGEMDKSGKKVASRKCTFAVIPQVPDAVRASPKNQFGAMVNPHTVYPFDQKEMDARFMNRIGIRYVRTHRLSWIHAQKSADSPIDWKNLDEEVALYEKYGIKPVATTGWPTPVWASDAAGSNLANKGNFVPKTGFMPLHWKFYSEMSRRYKGKIAYFEIGNEVDASNFWLGQLKNAQTGDDKAIFQDYIDYYIATAKAIKSGDPSAKVGPGTTGAMPDGHTYKPWLDRFLQSPAAEYTDIFCTHYKADLNNIRDIMKKHNKTVPVVITEIGGLVLTETYETTPENLRKLGKLTYSQFVPQLNSGGLALCKFLLRRIPEVKEGWISEMLDADYTIRPEFVAYATLIRLTGNADFEKELNITRNVDSGWLEGYRCKEGDKVINIIMLNDSPGGKATFKTPDKSLKLIDVMGNETVITPVNGKFELLMEENLPVFIAGGLVENEGAVKHPEPQLVSRKFLTLTNGNFEATLNNGRIPGWNTVTDGMSIADAVMNSFAVKLDAENKAEGKYSLFMSSEKQTQWYGVLCQLPMNEIPNPKPGEYVIFNVTYKQKGENIVGTGAGLTLGFRADDMRRVSFGGGNWDKGTFDWTAKSFITKPYTSFHKDCKKITLEFYLGIATGKVWIDDVKVEVELWRKSNAAANYIN